MISQHHRVLGGFYDIYNLSLKLKKKKLRRKCEFPHEKQDFFAAKKISSHFFSS